MKISIVIPTYNRAVLLKKCLDSLVNQTHPKTDYEIIVVDDGSQDNTEAILKNFYNKINIVYFKQSNKGPGAARNLGIKNTKGEIIAFIDDDCTADKDWLENIDNLYKTSPDMEIIQGKSSLFDCDNPISKMYQAFSRLANERRIIRSPDNQDRKYALFFGPLNASIKKSTILRYNLYFDENLTRRGDIDLYRRIKESGLDIIYSEKVSVSYSYQCNDVRAFIKRHFYYGRGECLLRQKWQGKEYIDTSSIGFTPDRLIKHYGLAWGMIIYFMAKSIGIIYHSGFRYEKLRHIKMNKK